MLTFSKDFINDDNRNRKELSKANKGFLVFSPLFQIPHVSTIRILSSIIISYCRTRQHTDFTDSIYHHHTKYHLFLVPFYIISGINLKKIISVSRNIILYFT